MVKQSVQFEMEVSVHRSASTVRVWERASETQQYENRLSRITFMKGEKLLEETLDKGFYHF
jgi:hypothetical protein